MLSFHGISGPECETNQVHGLIKIRPLGYEKDRPWTQFPGMGTDKRKRNNNRYVMKFPGNIVRIRFLYEQLESWQYYNACIVYERRSTREKLHHVRQNLTINRISSHGRSSRRKLLANMIKILMSFVNRARCRTDLMSMKMLGARRRHRWQGYHWSRLDIQSFVRVTSAWQITGAKHKSFTSNFFFQFNVGVRASLRAPRLIPRALKLTTM
jgi:hypothetical protein